MLEMYIEVNPSTADDNDDDKIIETKNMFLQLDKNKEPVVVLERIRSDTLFQLNTH